MSEHPHTKPNGRRQLGLTRVSAIGLVLAAGVLAVLVWQTLSLGAHTCKVCVQHNGHSQCRTVSAKTVDEARRGAITNACAFVSAGVTDSMACQREPLLSESCH